MLTINGNSEEIVKKFQPFGLTAYESKVYFTLQVCGKTRVGNLWIKAGVPQSKIYNIIPVLLTKGLVEIVKRHPLEVKAKPFLRFANDYLTERKCALKEIEETIEEYKGALRNNGRLVEVVM